MTTDQKIDMFIAQFIKQHKEVGWYSEVPKETMKTVLEKYLRDSYLEQLEVISKMLDYEVDKNGDSTSYQRYEKQLDSLEDDLMTRMEKFLKRTK